MPVEFGPYQLHELLGRGGMGEVYRAFDTVHQRTVALKRLTAELANDESFKSRFRRESLLAARLNEPHIIPIHDFGEIDGQLFIDMRLVEGSDLGAVIARYRALPASVAVDIIGQVAAALDAAHANGLVHRDVKPSNVLLTGGQSDPFAYLVDFGIARSVDAATSVTATSSTVGTIAYMAPERLTGDPGDHRVDIYALACVLYESLTGRRAFDGELPALMYAHVNLPPPRPSANAANVAPALDDVIAKGMAKDPRDRYGSASELARAARAALSTPSGRPLATTPLPAGSLPAGSRPAPLSAPPAFAPTQLGAPAPPSGPARASRRNRWPLIAVTIAVALVIAAVAIVLANRQGGSTNNAGTHTSSSVPNTPATTAAGASITVCERTHDLTQQAEATQVGSTKMLFQSCSAPPVAGADADGYLVITAYTLATTLPESSGASDYDFIVGPCHTFKLTYSFASQGANQILPSFDIDEGSVKMEGANSPTPLNLATADPALSVIPTPETGQAVYVHDSSNGINQASCAAGGSTAAAVPSTILASAGTN